MDLEERNRHWSREYSGIVLDKLQITTTNDNRRLSRDSNQGTHKFKSKPSPVDGIQLFAIGTRLRTGRSGDSNPSRGKRFFLFSRTSQPAMGPTPPPIIFGYQEFFPREKADRE